MNLTKQALSGADLSDATLTEAFLHKVDMSPLQWGREEKRTNLSDANLRYAIMDEANLRGTILDGADFTCAALGKADFTGATGIKWKQLEDQAWTLSGATKPDGTIYVQQQPPPLGSCPQAQ